MRILPLVVVLGVIAFLPACSRFGVREAAVSIAFARQCEPIELSIEQGHRGAFEAVGCDHVGLWRCAGRQCVLDESAGADRQIGRAIAAAQRAAAELDAAVLECTEQRPVTVQWMILPDGRPHLESFVTDIAEGPARLCVVRVIWRAFTAPDAAGALFSHRFGAPPVEPERADSPDSPAAGPASAPSPSASDGAHQPPEPEPQSPEPGS